MKDVLLFLGGLVVGATFTLAMIPLQSLTPDKESVRRAIFAEEQVIIAVDRLKACREENEQLSKLIDLYEQKFERNNL